MQMLINEEKQWSLKEVKELAQVANILKKIKDPNGDVVWSVVDQALSNSGNLGDSSSVFAYLANEYAAKGEFTKAIEMAKKIEVREKKVKTIWKVVNKLAKKGHIEEATTLLAIAKEEAQAETDLVLKAELLSGTGGTYRFVDKSIGVPLVQEAQNIIESLPNGFERAILLNESGAHFVDVDLKEEAEKVFELARKEVDFIETSIDKAKALAMLGGEKAEKGFREKAPADLVDALEFAKESDSVKKEAVMSEVARNFGQCRQFDMGIDAANEIHDLYQRSEGYLKIIKNLTKVDQENESRRLLKMVEEFTNLISNKEEKIIVLRKISSEYVALKDYEKAKVNIEKALELF